MNVRALAVVAGMMAGCGTGPKGSEAPGEKSDARVSVSDAALVGVHASSRAYLKGLIERGVVPNGRFYSSWSLGKDSQAVELAKLVIAGRKTATSSLGWWYTVQGDRRPQVGDISVVTDPSGNPYCVVEDTVVADVPYNQVDAAHAAAEGEGDLSLESWRQVHWPYFSANAEQLGMTPTEEMPVTTERLRLVHVNR